MSAKLQLPHHPLLYLITSGETSAQTTPATEDFSNVLQLIQAAVTARIDLVQIREKNLSANVLYELSARAARITKGSATKLLVNDRSDIAVSAEADGVHLTTSSLSARVVRQTFGDGLLIGVSTHSLDEAQVARLDGADFIVYGPVFATDSKSEYGDPLGLTKLARVCYALSPFPVLALGGVSRDNVAECIEAGASGIAAIRMLGDPQLLGDIAKNIHEMFRPGGECSSSSEFKL